MNQPIQPDVVIVGAGPAGLAAARALMVRGVDKVMVVDREGAAGGLPRFCNYPGFGWAYHRRIATGPAFVRRLISVLTPNKVDLRLRTTVLSVGPGPTIELVGPDIGRAEIEPRAVILATGIRELPRGARMVPGMRPERGVSTTGMLQRQAMQGVARPGQRIVVAGTEHVSFSVLLTARHFGHRVVAMIEPGDRVVSYALVGAFTRSILGIPIHLNSTIEEVVGREQVEAVVVRRPKGLQTIACDGVVFTGQFVPDAPLAAAGIDIDTNTGGPAVDQMMRTSAPAVFAAGNLLRPVETSGVAALEGARAGACVAAFLKGELAGDRGDLPINVDEPIRYLVPQFWHRDEPDPVGAMRFHPSLRVSVDLPPTRIVLSGDGVALWTGRCKRHLRERRVAVDLSQLNRTRVNRAAIALMID